MDAEDQKDIIKKVKTAGNKDADDESNDEPSDDSDADMTHSDGEDLGSYGANQTANDSAVGGENAGGGGNAGGMSENETDLFIEPKKNNMFQPHSNDILNVDKNLKESKNSRIFDKNIIKMRLKETFKQDNSEPMVEPMTKPAPTKPAPVERPEHPTQPSRRNKPFLPTPEVQPDPKAKTD